MDGSRESSTFPTSEPSFSFDCAQFCAHPQSKMVCISSVRAFRPNSTKPLSDRGLTNTERYQAILSKTPVLQLLITGSRVRIPDGSLMKSTSYARIALTYILHVDAM